MHEENSNQGSARLESAGKVLRPAVDIMQQEGGLLMLADLPGVAEEGIEITVEKGVLTLQAEVPAPSFEGKRLAYGEYESRRYHRQFSLGDEIDAEGIEASYRDGLLQLVLPKAARARKIEVKLT